MKTLQLLATLFSLSAALPFSVHADNLPLPADTPAVFKAECASCHIAFPPQLMAADDWRQVMAKLDRHYGDNASLDPKTRRSIEDFLVRNAARGKNFASAGAATNSKEPPRLTDTVWFKRKHHEVSRANWTHAKVKTPSNCAACHTKAAEGSYREREILMPNGQRWED